jgi:hypothetical protein
MINRKNFSVEYTRDAKFRGILQIRQYNGDCRVYEEFIEDNPRSNISTYLITAFHEEIISGFTSDPDKLILMNMQNEAIRLFVNYSVKYHKVKLDGNLDTKVTVYDNPQWKEKIDQNDLTN